MPLLKGAVNLIELVVPAEVVFDDKQVREHLFMDIDDSYDEFSVGWVNPSDMFDTSAPSQVLGEYVVLSMRVDKRTVPGAVLKKLVAKEIRRVMQEKQVPKLSRASRIEIKARIQIELLRKAKPTSATFEAVWRVHDHRLFFLGAPGSPMDSFLELFSETFGGDLTVIEHERNEDFLAWAWWQSEEISIAGRMVIGEGPEQQVVCAEGPEAFKALALGKKISQAQIKVDGKGVCTLVPDVMVFKGMKLPTVAAAGDIDDGLVLERIHLITELVDAVHAEYQEYLGADLSGMHGWVEESI